MPKIALVDDDRNILTSVSLTLEAEGYQVATYTDGASGLEGLTTDKPDLAILDIKMPRMDGMELLRRLRQKSDVPVIFLTSKDEEIDELFGLKMGADDYIAKPFSFKEVQARIHAILRRNQWLQERRQPLVLENDRIRLDVTAQQVKVAGQLTHLTPIEFKLLFTLMVNAGKAMSKSDLFLEVWGYEFIGGTNLVEVTVRRVREKIEIDPSQPVYLLTVRGAGYRFRRPDEPVAAAGARP